MLVGKTQNINIGDIEIMKKILNKRKALEKKYSNYCLYFKIPLPEVGNRVISLSPTAYYNHTFINADSYDSKLYKFLNQKAHFGIRKQIEDEVKEILTTDSFEIFGVKYFFELKQFICNITFDELNRILSKKKLKKLRKDIFNRLLKLFRRWGEESIKCHYKITGAKKRIHKKLLLEY